MKIEHQQLTVIAVTIVALIMVIRAQKQAAVSAAAAKSKDPQPVQSAAWINQWQDSVIAQYGEYGVGFNYTPYR